MHFSRSELYAWVALASSGAIALYYLIAVIGFPGPDSPMVDGLRGPLLTVFGWALLFEILLGIAQSLESTKVEKDERDRLIEGKGFRNAYFFVIAIVVSLLGHVVFWKVLAGGSVTGSGLVMFHTLVMTLLLASVVNAATKLFYYMRGS
ncbi:MAG: hypothetical protein HKN29_14865 [Rhodothermales bacterium]|nr:hypothetical protein [Rhodothermales bacterium]